MKKKKLSTLIIIFTLFTTINYSKNNNLNNTNQNVILLKDLLLLKKMSTEQCQDFLILNDWEYLTTEYKSVGGSFFPNDTKTHIFKNKFLNIKINIEETEHFQPHSQRQIIEKRTRKIKIIAENSNSYKILLTDLYKNNFKIIGKEVEYGKIDIATSTPEEMMKKMRKDYVNTRTTSKKYNNGNDEITVYIEVFEKLDKNYDTLKQTKYIFAL